MRASAITLGTERQGRGHEKRDEAREEEDAKNQADEPLDAHASCP